MWQNPPMSDLARHYQETVLKALASLKTQAERALDQVPDDALAATLDAESNSLVTLVKHLAGNLRSRFTDFLTSDGEKPDRDRDGEFEGGLSRDEAMARWQAGWECAFRAIRALEPEDLLRSVSIRGKPHTVVQALSLAQSHYASHVGQIVFLAKHLAGPRWKTLSVPRRGRATP